LNKVLLRKIEKQRAADQQDERSSDMDDDDADEGDNEVSMTSTRKVVKAERRRGEDTED
jgi:hypothetical protein